MRLNCIYSGLEFQVQYFGGLKGYKSIHPIFELPTKTLLSRVVEFSKQTTTREEKRLLFLALLNSSGLIEWRNIAEPSDKTVAQNFEYLAKTIGWLDMYSYDQKLSRRTGPAFPKFVISPETKKLENVHYWLEAWEQARKDYETGTRRETILEKIQRRERALERMIKDPHKTPEDYSWLLAQWAADAAEFPEKIRVRLPQGEELSLRDYWIRIMTEKEIFSIREQDFVELEEHLTDNLEHGSIYAHDVLKLVRTKINKQRQSLGLGDIFSKEELDKINASPFTIVTDAVEDENIQTIAATAPTREPARNDYRDNLSYLKARARWLLFRRTKEQQQSN